jgi:type I restriction enzyme S subunit
MYARVLPSLLPELEAPTRQKVRSFSVHARWLHDGDYRLDASFHADEVIAAERAVVESGFPVKPLADTKITQRLFWPARFKRIYTNNPSEGFPFLQASQASMFRPLAKGLIAKSKARNAENYIAQEGWILVTRSGVVGRCVLVGKRLTQFFLSEDLIRVVPVLPAGYLYAFLSTWMGQALMVKERYGGTITHLEPHHLQGIPVPLLPYDEQRAIHEQIMKAYRLRDEANDFLDQADELLHTELSLSRFDESEVPYLVGVTNPKAFAVKMSELAERLDASFHLPVAKAAVKRLNEGKYPLVQLGEVAHRIFIPPRFKRIYVSPEYGVPFLQGSHIPLTKPYDLKYLSRHANERYIGECLIHTGWILLTRSGTVGRLMLVPSALETWAASEHCLRIIANSELVHPGYLAAFLMTPYGQCQLLSKIYGGVVDELTEDDTAAIWLPDAPLDVQQRISTLVVQAFEKKEEANQIEEQAIRNLEKTITKSV